MEIEVKLLLPSREAYEKLIRHLSPKFIKEYKQRNVFFDGTGRELSSARSTLRLRFYGSDDVDEDKCVLTHKGPSAIQDGVSSVQETEHRVDQEVAKRAISDPSLLLQLTNSSVMQRVREDHPNLSSLQSLGGFENLRKEFQWDDQHKLEVDWSQYEFGDLFEIECETGTPQELRSQITSMLEEQSIPFADSTKSKFARFVTRSLE